MVDRRQSSQTFDRARQHIQNVVNIFFGVVFAKAETNRATRQLVVAAESLNDRRGLNRPGRASRAGRDRYALHVQMNQQTFAFDKPKRNIREMRETLFATSVEDDLTGALGNLLLKSIAQAASMFVAFRHFALGQFRRRAKRDDVGNGFRASAPLSLLMTTDLLRGQTHAAADKQGSRSFRRVNLVRRKRKQITTQRFNVDRNSAGGLHGVRVK